MSSQSHPRIAIIGAGISGLTLARVLQVHNIPSKIYERETSPRARQQGGSLDLRLDTGQAALKAAQLHDEFRKHMRSEGQDMKIADKTGKVLFARESNEGDEYNPEIDRKLLRQIFLDVLGEQIQWGRRVNSVTKVEGGHQIKFENGSTEEFDLIIGCDGASSYIRSLIPSATPHAAYTGVLGIESYIEDIRTSHPAQYKTIGRGSLFARADGKGLLSQQNGDGTARVYITMCVQEDFPSTSGIPWDKPDDAKALLLERYYADWADEFKALITAGNGVFRPWPILALPVGHSWTHEKGLTVIGDAAHVMSPFAGEGANIAMLDAAQLGEAIATSTNGDLDAKVEAFEKVMFERAKGAAAKSDRQMREFMGNPEEINGMVEKMKARVAAAMAMAASGKAPQH